MKKEVLLLQRVVEFLESLSDEESEKLINGEVALQLKKSEELKVEAQVESQEAATQEEERLKEDKTVKESKRKTSNGRKRRIKKVEKVEKEEPAEDNAVDTKERIWNHLVESQSSEQAQQYLSGIKLTKKDLKEIADANQVIYTSRDTKQVLMERIIETAVGARMRFDVLMHTDLKK